MFAATAKTPFDITTGDSLDDILGPLAPTARPAVTPPESYRPREVGHTEPCKACRGSGQFRSYAGRLIGQCFKCKGKGSRTFMTSSAERDRRREQAATTKVRKADEAIAEFKAAYPDVWAWMDGSTFPIAVELLGKIRQYGSLTDNQVAFARRMIAKREAKQAERNERIAAAPEISMAKIEAAFAQAHASGLKRIKVRFVGLTFSEAPAASANAGALYVKRDGEYLGKIMGGKFMGSRACTDEVSKLVLAVASDQKAAAKAYGIQTGSCSCCGRELTDPQSVAAGIGPICASKFGW